MPEAPDLEVIKEYLTEHVVDTKITRAAIVKPSVLRSLAGDMTADIQGRSLESVDRRGKFLLIGLSGNRILAINPMLTGMIQHCAPESRLYKRTCLTFDLSDGTQLRYLDEKQMGLVYYIRTAQLDQVPRLNEQGPDVLDGMSFEEFQQRLKRYPGEIKGILTRGAVLSGIGNAYSDEILFEAQVYPFRKRKSLSDDELRRILEKSRSVVEDAIPILRERMGENIHVKVRDFLKVHNKGGQPSPRCGHQISEITANKRITSYCRQCQPGMLLRN